MKALNVRKLEEIVQENSIYFRKLKASLIVRRDVINASTEAEEVVESRLSELADKIVSYPLEIKYVQLGHDAKEYCFVIDINDMKIDSWIKEWTISRECEKSEKWGDFIIPEVTILGILIGMHRVLRFINNPIEKYIFEDVHIGLRVYVAELKKDVFFDPVDCVGIMFLPYLSDYARKRLESFISQFIYCREQYTNDLKCDINNVTKREN